MQHNRVYSAASVTDVINLLKQHVFSGVLVIRRVTDPHLEEARISIELGQPMQIRLGTREEYFTNSTLSWLNSWGAIYFVFQATEIPLQLPPPQASAPSASPSSPTLTQSESLPSSTRPRSAPAVTRPLPTLPPLVREQAETYTPQHTNGRMRIPETPRPHEQSGGDTPPAGLNGHASDETIPTLALEMAIPAITQNGRNYPITHIRRYDRTIFLLINGRRTVAELAQLTRRTLQEVYATLYRLKKLDLIVVEA